MLSRLFNLLIRHVTTGMVFEVNVYGTMVLSKLSVFVVGIKNIPFEIQILGAGFEEIEGRPIGCKFGICDLKASTKIAVEHDTAVIMNFHLIHFHNLPVA